jgi:hypothetical protein
MPTLLEELSMNAQMLTIEERAQLAQELLESAERDVDPDAQRAASHDGTRPLPLPVEYVEVVE